MTIQRSIPPTWSAPSKRDAFHAHYLRRRPDHRRRRVRRGVGLEPGRDADAHPLPRAGRLDEAVRIPEHAAATGRRASSATSHSARTGARARGLSGQRRRLADRGRQLQRRRRQHDPVRRRTSRAFIRRDFRVRTLDGVADDWPIDYATLEPYYAENDRMMGVSGLAGDPAYPPKELPLPPLPLGKLGATLARGLQQARLALVAVGQRDRHAGVRGPRAVHQPRRTALSGCAQGAKASTDITYWPRGDPRRASSCGRAAGCARSPSTSTAWRTASIYYDADGVEQFQRAEVVVARLQRHRHAAPAAELALDAVPRRPRQPQRPGRQEPDVPSLRAWSPASSTSRSTATRARGCCIMSQEFYETDRVARLRARLLRSRSSRGFGPGADRAVRAWRRAACRGARTPPRLSPSCSTAPPAWWRSARTCRRSTTRVTLDPDADGRATASRRRRSLPPEREQPPHARARAWRAASEVLRGGRRARRRRRGAAARSPAGT